MTTERVEGRESHFDEEAINLHIGRRLRRRRRIVGMTQLGLGSAVDVKFQQVQKYECAANRITAARLYMLATALRVPVQYFFEGLQGAASMKEKGEADDEDLDSAESHEVLEAYYKLPWRARRRLVTFMKALIESHAETETERG